MNNDLQTLIKILEEEKSNLLQLIDNSVKDREYLFAHSHFEALKQLNGRLQTLKNLEDESYDMKYFKAISIENLKTQLESEASEKMKSMLSRMITANEVELQKLNERAQESTNQKNGTVVSDYLEQLAKRKISGFRIVLSKGDGLILEIRRSKGSIKMTLPFIKRLERENLLFEKRIDKLKALGFQLVGKEKKLTQNISVDKLELPNKIKTLLSIIVFEVFYFKELDKESYIEVLGKGVGFR